MVTVVLENKILAIFPIKWLKILIFVPIYIGVIIIIIKKRQSLATKLIATTLLNIFLLEVNFYKSTIRLQFFLISSMFTKFLKN